MSAALNSLPVHAKRHVGKSLLSLTSSHRQKRHSRLPKTSLPIKNSLLVYTKHLVWKMLLEPAGSPLILYPSFFVRRDRENDQKCISRDVEKSKLGETATFFFDDSIVQNPTFSPRLIEMRENENYRALYFTVVLKSMVLQKSSKSRFC